ncbi:MAG: response regulator, partial [Chromatiales bacterium]|nr:response regulator [Chromatiales bacterium]
MAVKVLIVDDSSFFRRRVKDMLSQDSRLEVIGEAVDGEDAVAKAKLLNPDIITMDIEMPRLDGISATRKIMAFKKIPILIFSSFSTAGAKLTLDALDAGAVDYLPKKLEDLSKNR